MRLQIKTYMLFWLLLCMVSCVQEEVAPLVPAEEVDQVSIELFTRLRSYDTPVSLSLIHI